MSIRAGTYVEHAILGLVLCCLVLSCLPHLTSPYLTSLALAGVLSCAVVSCPVRVFGRGGKGVPVPVPDVYEGEDVMRYPPTAGPSLIAGASPSRFKYGLSHRGAADAEMGYVRHTHSHVYRVV